jgi:glucose/arabinose dehydrogenase
VVRRLPASLLLIAAVGCGGPEAEPTLSPAPAPSPSPSVASTPTPPTTPSPPPDPASASVRLELVAELQEPLALAVREGDDALYVGQKTGEVMAIRGGDVREVIDLSGVVSQGGEQGLLGLAFSPEGRFLYVNFTDLVGDTRIVEYAMRGGQAAIGTRRQVLSVDQPYSNHNGGHLLFGPDGYLYIGLGDGGSGGDPEDRAQDLGSPLGKMLRVDPRPGGGRPYTVPPDNPFVGREDALPEIWAWGLRNPWRYSFDRETGDLWIADVGQDAREEVDLLAAGRAAGANLGWDGYEGTLVFEEPVPDDTVPPVYDYGRDLGATVIGGHVYRGSAIPALRGAYLFGDLYNPDIRMLVPDGSGFRHLRLGVEVENLSSFGEDHRGELYLLSLSGPVYRLAPA